jgi:hypothetical protein
MNRLTIGELRDLCDESNIAFPANARKGELLALLQAQRRSVRDNSWLALAGALVALAASFYGVYRWAACDSDCRAERLLLASQIDPVVGMPPYVPRPQLEAILADVVGHADLSYVAMIGPRGAGKTRVVMAAVANRTGVVQLDLGERFKSREVVYRAILLALGENVAPALRDVSIEAVTRLFERVKVQHRRLHPAAVDWVPTVIAEVRIGLDDHKVIRDVVAALRPLKRSCRVILLLCDPDDAFGLPNDGFEQTLVWVDDFTIGEANQFFDNVGCLPLRQRFDANNTDLNEQLRRRLFEFVGTRPSALESVAAQLARGPIASLAERVDALISEQIEHATHVLGTLFAQSASPSGAEFRSLVETMLQTPGHAVPAATLSGDLGIPEVASKVLKDFHALMYHVPSDTYRFFSPAYFHAAKRKVAERKENDQV